MSEHETVLGQTSSISLLASSMISKPLTLAFGPAIFSDGFSVVESIKREASQPYIYKYSRY